MTSTKPALLNTILKGLTPPIYRSTVLTHPIRGWQPEPTPMTTPDDRPQPSTPDAHIAADWGVGQVPLPSRRGTVYVGTTADAERIAAATIDTSTTAGKVSVMTAHDRGERVEVSGTEWRDSQRREWHPVGQQPRWNWELYDYRIAPAPVRTALEAAREYVSPHEFSASSADGRLFALLMQIGHSPRITLESGPKRNIHWGAIDPNELAPGRYRLVRDEP